MRLIIFILLHLIYSNLNCSPDATALLSCAVSSFIERRERPQPQPKPTVVMVDLKLTTILFLSFLLLCLYLTKMCLVNLCMMLKFGLQEINLGYSGWYNSNFNCNLNLRLYKLPRNLIFIIQLFDIAHIHKYAETVWILKKLILVMCRMDLRVD